MPPSRSDSEPKVPWNSWNSSNHPHIIKKSPFLATLLRPLPIGWPEGGNLNRGCREMDINLIFIPEDVGTCDYIHHVDSCSVHMVMGMMRHHNPDFHAKFRPRSPPAGWSPRSTEMCPKLLLGPPGPTEEWENSCGKKLVTI